MVKISIIVPCYNQATYISECLDSVLVQTFKDYEIIVVNDGSTDNSLEILKDYADKYPQIKVINQVNQGVCISRNVALSIAQAEYIFPLDGDDKISPNCLEMLYCAMISGKGDVIYSLVRFFGIKNTRFHLLPVSKRRMLFYNCVVCSAMYRRVDAIKYGGYDENMGKGLEDWEFWLNFINDNKRFHLITEELFFYRVVEQSRNQSISKKDNAELHNYIIKKHNKLFAHFYFNRLLRLFYDKKLSSSGKLKIKILNITLYKKYRKNSFET